MFLILGLCSLLLSIASPASVAPNWAVTAGIKTGILQLFSNSRTAGTNQAFTVNYLTPFTPPSANPFVAYGIQRYRGTDFLLQESFSMALSSPDSTGFIIQLQITGITAPLLMAVSYIAVDPVVFTYYYNCFTEVPLNYDGSPLASLSTMSASVLTHTQVIDYTDQTANFATIGPKSTFNTFSTPFSKYRIALFLTSIAMTSTSTIPVSFDITATVLSTSTYSMTATLGTQATITMLQFSQVFFDSSQFSVTSNNYLYFQEWSITNTAVTSFFPVNIALAGNFMMGLKSFTSTSGQCYFEYQWVFATVNSSYGAQIQMSNPVNSSNGTCGLSGDVSTILFMMKWTCLGGYPYFDLTSQLCLDICNPRTYLNSTDSTCYPCQNTACYTCDNITNSNICLTCATNYVLVNNTCICDTSQGMYLYINGQCYDCNDLLNYCSLCAYSGSISTTYNASNFMCLTCNSTLGYFIDPFNTCQPCSVPNCVTCLGYTTCSVCIGGYGVTASGTCSTCPLTGCQTCINTTACSVCSTGYNKINNLCYTCPTSCTCGGYTLPKYANGDCSTICGDGIVIFPYEGCDDGNTNNGDGCSSSCKVQTYSSCSGQPSSCYFTSTLTGSLINSQVSQYTCNIITFNFQITPVLLLLSNPNITWFTALASQNTSILYNQISSSYSNGIISLTYAFNQNLQGLNVIFKVNPQNMNSSTYLYYTPISTFTFPVIPSNNILAVYLSSKSCSGIDSTQKFLQAEAGISYFGLLLSTFSCKIIGLEMFGVLQLSYFSLSNYDYVPPALMGILQRKEVNGLNIQTSPANDNNIPSRVTSNGYTASDFLTNINIMLLVTAVIAITGLVMYMVTYLINKDSIDQENLSEALKSVDNDNSSRGEPKEEQTRSQYWHRISKYILKQVLLTFVIFNIFNISYSAGIQIKYINDVSSFSIICLLLTFTLIIVISGAQVVTDKAQFGEYIDKFKKDRLQSKYMIATIIYRFTLGFLLAMINDWIASGIVFTFISAAFLTYICYFEPFTDKFQNIRSKFIHSVHVLILFVNYYYRMEANGNSTELSQISVPAYIQIVAVAISVIGSTILLAYEFIKKYILKTQPTGEAPQQPKEGSINRQEEVKHHETINILQEFN